MENQFEHIKNALEKGSIVHYYAKRRPEKEPDSKNKLQPQHSYTVIGITERDGNKFVTLKDPWAKGALRYTRTVGPDGRETLQREKNEDNEANGVFEVEFNDFIRKACYVQTQAGGDNWGDE